MNDTNPDVMICREFIIEFLEGVSFTRVVPNLHHLNANVETIQTLLFKTSG